jgi:hypothetical protein
MFGKKKPSEEDLLRQQQEEHWRQEKAAKYQELEKALKKVEALKFSWKVSDLKPQSSRGRGPSGIYCSLEGQSGGVAVRLFNQPCWDRSEIHIKSDGVMVYTGSFDYQLYRECRERLRQYIETVANPFLEKQRAAEEKRREEEARIKRSFWQD